MSIHWNENSPDIIREKVANLPDHDLHDMRILNQKQTRRLVESSSKITAGRKKVAELFKVMEQQLQNDSGDLESIADDFRKMVIIKERAFRHIDKHWLFGLRWVGKLIFNIRFRSIINKVENHFRKLLHQNELKNRSEMILGNMLVDRDVEKGLAEFHEHIQDNLKIWQKGKLSYFERKLLASPSMVPPFPMVLFDKDFSSFYIVYAKGLKAEEFGYIRVSPKIIDNETTEFVWKEVDEEKREISSGKKDSFVVKKSDRNLNLSDLIAPLKERKPHFDKIQEKLLEGIYSIPGEVTDLDDVSETINDCFIAWKHQPIPMPVRFPRSSKPPFPIVVPVKDSLDFFIIYGKAPELSSKDEITSFGYIKCSLQATNEKLTQWKWTAVNSDKSEIPESGDSFEYNNQSTPDLLKEIPILQQEQRAFQNRFSYLNQA